MSALLRNGRIQIMKITKKISTLAFTLLFVFGFASTSFAQETAILDITNESEFNLDSSEAPNDVLPEASIEDIVSEEVALELGLDGQVAISNDLTLEEAIEIIIDADEAGENEIIMGDVVITTDEYVVIQTVIGEYIKIPVTSKKGGQRKRTGAFIALSAARPGHTLTIVPEASSNTKVLGATYINGSVTNASGTNSYKVSSSTKVIINGEESSQSELNNIEESDNVTVVTDSEGEVIAITIIEEADAQEEEVDSMVSETEEEKKTPWGWIVGIIAVLGIVVATRRSK